MFLKSYTKLLHSQCRYFASSNSGARKRMRDKLSVLAQDQEQYPLYEFSRSEKNDRRVYVWGFAATGALGINQSLRKQASPKAHIVNYPTRQSFAERRKVLDISAGFGFTLLACQRENDNISLFGTGLNTDSQVGYHKLGGVTNKPMEEMIYPAPIFLPRKDENEEIHVKKVAAGRAHSVVLSTDGTLFTFGNNAFGQCGRSVIEDEVYAASQMIHRIERGTICNGEEIVEMICGLDHTLLLTKDGNVWSCGWGADGQTGLGHYDSVSSFTQVKGDIANEKIVKVASRVDCTLAINDRGDVFGWGNSEYGQLEFDGINQQINTPIHLKFTKKCDKIVDVAAGGSFCMALNESGNVFVWGFGILGLGPNVDQIKEPTLIPPILFGRNQFNPKSRVTSIACGVNHLAAVTDTHDVFMWGRNKFGCLGFGTKSDKDQFFPLKVQIGAKCLKISCGVDHSIAFCEPHM